MQQETMNWKAMLKDSSWVTVAWDWLMTLISRAVEFVLWTTMIFSCYQLIPDAPQPPVGVSTFVFIAQFIGLDVGGMGLNKLAQQHGLATWSYTRIISYILIGITLVTVAYAGLVHVVVLDAKLTAGVEVALVMARSIMTVLYGQAIHALKHTSQQTHVLLAELRQEVDTLRGQVNSKEHEVSTLQHEVSSGQQQVSTLQQHLSTREHEVSTLRVQVEQGQQEAAQAQEHLKAALVQVAELRRQVDAQEHELEQVRVALSSEQQEVSSLRTQLEQEQYTVSTLRAQVDRVRGQHTVDSGYSEQAVDTVDSVASGQHKATTEDRRVIRLDVKRTHHREQYEAAETLNEQIKEIVQRDPTLSDRAIAAQLGCSPTTVGKWRRKQRRNDEVSVECVND